MNKYLDLTIDEIHVAYLKKELTPKMLLDEVFERMDACQDLNCIITATKEEAYQRAEELSKEEVGGPLWGIPIVIKDNIITKQIRTTCASKMLENFIPIYQATVIDKILKAGMIIVGKTNMDEFAMGSTSETSYFGPPKNPWNPIYITGGSSGGSAGAVASRMVPFALGSDTGGSIRQPASYTGLVGMKPTYGRVSRYGLVAFASSLDQIGPMTRTVYENAVLLNVIAGFDEKDLTSSKKKVEDYTAYLGKETQSLKIGIPSYLVSEVVSEEVRDVFNHVVDLLKKHGNTVEMVEVSYLEQAVPLYQILAMAEASSNLARFDGIRYGYRIEDSKNIDFLYEQTRKEGFGEEVKRRIMVGSSLLSGENAKKYYDKALSIRDDMRSSFLAAFKDYDLLIAPTTTTAAYPLGQGLDDPLKGFMDDILVIPANMAGLPAMNLPAGFSKENLPIGMQIIGAPFQEGKMYQLASFLEKMLDLDLEGGKRQ